MRGPLGGGVGCGVGVGVASMPALKVVLNMSVPTYTLIGALPVGPGRLPLMSTWTVWPFASTKSPSTLEAAAGWVVGARQCHGDAADREGEAQIRLEEVCLRAHHQQGTADGAVRSGGDADRPGVGGVEVDGAGIVPGEVAALTAGQCAIDSAD